METISFQNELAPSLQNWAKEELKREEAIIKEASDRRQQIKQILERLNGKSHAPLELVPKEFDKNASWAKRISFVLGHNPDLKTVEILDKLVSLDKTIAKVRPQSLKTISTILSIGNNKKYSRRKDEHDNFRYSLKESLT